MNRYPGTPASHAALHSALKRSWDFGELGTFLRLVNRLPADQQRYAAQLAAARGLLAPPEPATVPSQLFEQLSESWSLDAGQVVMTNATRPQPGRMNERWYQFAVSEDNLCVASNGVEMFLFDPWQGVTVGPRQPLTNRPSNQHSPAPVIGRDIAVAVGHSLNQNMSSMTMVAVNRRGELRWKWPQNGVDNVSSVSAPVIA